MNKTNLTVRLAVAVLSAGLVSCAKDKKDPVRVRDNFKAPPPVINNKGQQDLKTWDRLSDKSLDLQDSFDVSNGNPAKLEVTARCRRDNLSYIETFTFVPRQPIKIFQVLPPDLLTADISAAKTDCAFELILSNDIGSKHIYQISSTPVTDQGAAGVTLEKNGSGEKVVHIQARKLEGLRARYRNAGPAAAQVYCQDMTLTELPFEQVAELIHFDFTKPEAKPGRPADITVQNNLQACRILIRQSGQLQQISPRFLVQLPKPPVTGALAQVLVPNSAEKINFFNGAALAIGFATVTNPDRSGVRWVSMSKAPAEANIESFGPGKMEGAIGMAAFLPPTVNNFKLQALIATPINDPSIGIQDKGDHWLISVPAGQSARFSLAVVPPHVRQCAKGTFRAQGDDMAVTGQISYSEVSEGGELLYSKTIDFPRVSYPGKYGYERHVKAVPGTPCSW